MRVEIVIFFILSVISVVLADVRYRGHAVHPDYPGQCYYEESSQPIPKDQTITRTGNGGTCEEIYCREDDVIEMRTCGRHYMIETAKCKIVDDKRLSWPECCPKYVCQPIRLDGY